MGDFQMSLDELQFHVGRSGRQLGRFDGNQLRDGLGTGEFLPSDLVWCEGMTDWRPLSEVITLEGQVRVEAKQGEVVNLRQEQEVLPKVQVFGSAGSEKAFEGVGVMPVPGVAIASLILGVVPVLLCPLALFTCIPGVICGHRAMSLIKAPGSRYEGKGVATVGLVLNYFWLFVAMCVLLFIVLVTVGAAGASVA